IDSSQSNYAQYIEEVAKVLKEIGAEQVPCLKVFNKIDLRSGFIPRITRGEDGKPTEVWVSAQTGAGIELLQAALSERLSEEVIYTEVTLKSEQGKLRAALYQLGAVLSEQIDSNGHHQLQIRLQRSDYKRLFHLKKSPEDNG
ncbi:MAG: GTPase HflX, partial [Proteobacteria bacterium]|nr:GTPase HflX [Pseudomonadota bacterium]